MRYFIKLSYDGTDYAGWQVQPNVKTIQGELESALSKLLNGDSSIIGCGRTDKGVHATSYVAHFDTEKPIEQDRFLFQLNGILPSAISCSRLMEVHDKAHARFDAQTRSYVYNLHFNKNPFKKRFSTFFLQGHRLDSVLLQEAADFLKKQKDFTSFCKAHTDNKTNFCTLYRSEWNIDLPKESVQYHITANRFLRGMVRLIVGSSLNIGLGKLTLEEFCQQVEAGKRGDKMYSAPAQGLALSQVTYDFI